MRPSIVPGQAADGRILKTTPGFKLESSIFKLLTRLHVRSAFVQLLQQLRQCRPHRGSRQVLRRRPLPTACPQRRIHVQLKMDPQRRLRLRHPQRRQQPQQRFHRGVLPCRSLFPEPVPTFALQMQAHRTPPTLGQLHHPARLAPTPVEQQHLQPGHVHRLRALPGQPFPAGMQDPHFAPRQHHRLPYRHTVALAHMDPRSRHHPFDQLPRAGRAPLFALMHQDIDLHRHRHRGRPLAETPPRRQQASPAPFRSCQHHAPRHPQTLPGDRSVSKKRIQG